MLGAHSIIKGDILIVANGCTVSPPMASIYLSVGCRMGPIKYRYIHYDKSDDQFLGQSVTGISSLRKFFGMSQVHWDWTDSPSTLKDEMAALIEDILVSRTDVSGSTLEQLKTLFACICFHYEHLDAHFHTNHQLIASPTCIASNRVKISTNMLSLGIPG